VLRCLSVGLLPAPLEESASFGCDSDPTVISRRHAEVSEQLSHWWERSTVKHHYIITELLNQHNQLQLGLSSAPWSLQSLPSQPSRAVALSALPARRRAGLPQRRPRKSKSPKRNQRKRALHLQKSNLPSKTKVRSIQEGVNHCQNNFLSLSRSSKGGSKEAHPSNCSTSRGLSFCACCKPGGKHSPIQVRGFAEKWRRGTRAAGGW